MRRGIKLEHLGEEYSPEQDSVIAAMVWIVVNACVRPAAGAARVQEATGGAGRLGRR